MQLLQYHLRLRRGRVRSVFRVFCAAVQKRPSFMWRRWVCSHHLHSVAPLQDPVLFLILRLWQAPGTGLHGNGDAHAAASDGHVGDALPFVPVGAVTLDTGLEALLVEPPCNIRDKIIKRKFKATE